MEYAIHENYSDAFVLAPSYLVREAWQIDEFKEFWSICVSNLLDKTEHASHPLYKATVPKTFKLQEKAQWNITPENIEKETERTENKMSCYFVLKWLPFEISNKKESSHPLLKNIVSGEKSTVELNNMNEILATCYFQFLEANKYL